MSPLTALAWVLPHRLLSSLARALAYSDSPRTSRWLIDSFATGHGRSGSKKRWQWLMQLR